jgi:hypothetical protein
MQLVDISRTKRWNICKEKLIKLKQTARKGILEACIGA